MNRMLRVFGVFTTLAVIVACGVTQQQPTATPTATAGATDTNVCATTTVPADAQFPANFDYPQSEPTVQGWVSSRNGHRERLHAYCVFAGLNQIWPGTNVPTWRTWGTSTQAFPNQYNPWKGTDANGQPIGSVQTVAKPLNEQRSESSDEAGDIGDIVNPGPVYGVNSAVANNPKYQQCLQKIPNTSPQLYALKDGQIFQSNGDIMVAAVSYNPAALQNILGTNLYNAVTLDGKLPSSSSGTATTINEFPSSSMVLKVMLWPVNGSTSGLTVLPVWDWDKNPPGSASDGQYAGYEMQKFWTRAVAVSTGSMSIAKWAQFLYGVLQSDGKTQLGPNTYTAVPVVGLDRFYSRKYSQADLDAMSSCDRAILDASAYWTYNRAFQAGDALALIAMHIMTKEQSDWTFQSAWWHPDAAGCTSSTRFCGHRPTSVPGGDQTYKNYMMTTTYGMQQQQGNPNYYAPPGSTNSTWPVAYNPYIELAATHPITTNCMNCHHRAAWPPIDSVNKPDRGRASTYLQSSPTNPTPLDTFSATNPVFNGLTLVDSMWAVSDRAGYPK